jgi:hypothetical protein
MKLNIQIASLAALEELTKGENTEISLEIRQNIADEYAKRYIKPLMNDTTIKSMVDKLTVGLTDTVEKVSKKVVEEKIGKVTKTNDWRTPFSISINEPLKNAITAQVIQQLDVLVNDTIAKVFQKNTEEVITNAVQKRVDRLVTEKIDEGVKLKLMELTRAAGIR